MLKISMACRHPSALLAVLVLVSCGKVPEATDDSTISEAEPSQTAVIAEVRRPNIAAGQRISLSDAVSLALVDSPDTGVARAQIYDAAAAVDAAEAVKSPVVDLSASTGLENTYAPTGNTIGAERTEATLSVEQTVYDFGAADEGIARREALLGAAQSRRLDVMEDVALETTLAYLDYLRQTELRRAAARNVADHERIAGIVRRNAEGGNATQADVNRANTRVEAAKSQQLETQNAIDDAIAEFRRLVGVKPDRITPPAQLAPNLGSLPRSALAERLEENPELVALTFETSALERQRLQQEAEIEPRVFVRGEVGYRDNVGGNTGSNGNINMTVGMTYRLFDGGAREARLRQTDARIFELRETYRGAKRDLEQDAEEVTQTLETNSENAAFANERFVTARDGLQLFQQQFDAGERTAFELLDAQRDFLQAETDLIENRYQAAASVYQSLRLRGELVSALVPSR